MLGSMSHTWRSVYVHVVWATRERRPLIDAHREGVIGRIIGARSKKAKSELLAFGASDDHVHALVSLHVSASVALLVRQFKSFTSRAIEVHDQGDELFRWQKGYAVLSVEPSDAAGLRQYIVNQRSRHRTGELVTAWEPPLDALGDDDAE